MFDAQAGKQILRLWLLTIYATSEGRSLASGRPSIYEVFHKRLTSPESAQQLVSHVNSESKDGWERV